MQSFIDKCVRYLYSTYHDGISELCIVFPNRRAGLFFKKGLSKLINKSIWAPDIFAIEDFVAEISGMTTIDNIDILPAFYKIYRGTCKEDPQNFDEFLKWAPLLISDFNEIDQHLTDAKKLFNELNEAKALSVWNMGEKPLTEFEKQYIHFFNSLGNYHDKLISGLYNKKHVYKGLAYRAAADLINDVIDEIKWKKIIFIGFNALSSSENKIVSLLIKHDKAKVLWDADEYFFHTGKGKEPVQEAGYFLHKNFKKTYFKNPKWIENNLKHGHKKIRIIGVPSNVGQAKFCGQILSEYINSEVEINNTAVILPDESLLYPVLNSIPEKVREFNVTMGLPLYLTPLYQLLEDFFNTNENAFNLSQLRNDNQIKYNARDIIKILRHPLISIISDELLSITTNSLNTCIKQMIISNKIFYTKNEIIDLLKVKNRNPFVNYVFEPFEKLKDQPLERFIHIIDLLKKSLIEKKNKTEYEYSLEFEYLFHFAKLINRLISLIDKSKENYSVKSIRELFSRIIRNTQIPFYGEPLKGLQIMGMLETRALDFKNIILLSANEGIIPSTHLSKSFIPLDIRIKYNLPTYRERDAIFAYHFYRLLQRSENIHLLYNTETNELGGGDKSRFLHQIIHELPKFNPEIKISEYMLSKEIKTLSRKNEITISKTNNILKKLLDLAKKGLSATSLNTFRTCSLKFYLSEILNLNHEENIEESIDAPTLGTIVHEVLSKIYQPFINTPLSATGLKDEIKKTEIYTKESFANNYSKGDLGYGKNLLLVNVAISIVKRFIDHEIKLLENQKKITVLGLEERLFKIIDIEDPSSKKNISVKLKGTIDRIDMLEDTLRIIDYKTGNINKSELTVKELDDIINQDQNDKAFQLIFYTMLARDSLEKNKKVLAGIYSLRNISMGLMQLKISGHDLIQTDTINEFEQIVRKIINDLFDHKTPFKQTDQIDLCNYCPYRSVCTR